MSSNPKGMIWGEIQESSLSMLDLMMLNDLCHANEDRVAYLVHLYNERSESLQPLEAHFVARYATRKGYKLVTDENHQTKFFKA